jgi:OmpA-OmpF porin, OOP family
MKRILFAATLLAAITLPTASDAQSVPRSGDDQFGPYVGGSIGNFGLGIRSLREGNSSKQQNSAGGKFFGGYRFNENIGVEIGGLSSGDVKRSYIVDGRSIERKGKVRAFYVAATGRLPLGENFALNGRLGVARGELSGVNALPANASIIGKKTGALIGFGGEYRFTRNLSGTVDLDYLPNLSQRTRAAVVSAGVKFAF